MSLRKLFFSVTVLALYCGLLHAAPYMVFSPHDPVLQDLRFLTRLAGRSFLSFTPPLSRDEVLHILNDVEEAALLVPEVHGRVLEALDPEPMLGDGVLGFSLRPETALQGRYRSEGDIPWVMDESQNPAVLKLPLEFFLGEAVYATGDLIIRTDPSYYDSGGDQFSGNLPVASSYWDMNMPLRSFISAGGPWWNLQLGRDKVSFGSGYSGNLGISDTPDYYEFLRFSLFSPNFKYSFFLTQAPLAIGDLLSDSAITAGYGDRDRYLRSTNQRYLYMHRWDFRLWQRLSIGIGEGLLVGDSPLELRFLNPLALYHSYFAWRDYPKWGGDADSDMVGSLLSLDVEWAILPSLAAYGQMVLNQYATPYELEHWPEDNSPNGLGWLGGVEYVTLLYGGAASFHLEALYTDPYLYVLSSPFSSFIWMRRLSELGSKDLRYTWIGHRAGRDTIYLSLGGDWKKGQHSFDVGISYTAKGRHDLEWDWFKGEESTQERTPSGRAENRWIGTASWGFDVTTRLSLATTLACTAIYNKDHVEDVFAFGGELVLGISYIFN